MRKWRVGKTTGVSLIELLCVIAIISILASLLLGPVLKAYKKVKSFAASEDSPTLVHRAVKRLRSFHEARQTYPVLTADYLFQQGVFDSKLMQYIREKAVVYIPFSSADADTNQIIWYDMTKDGYRAVLKADITAPRN